MSSVMCFKSPCDHLKHFMCIRSNIHGHIPKDIGQVTRFSWIWVRHTQTPTSGQPYRVRMTPWKLDRGLMGGLFVNYRAWHEGRKPPDFLTQRPKLKSVRVAHHLLHAYTRLNLDFEYMHWEKHYCNTGGASEVTSFSSLFGGSVLPQ